MVTTIEYLLAFPPDGNTTDKVYDKAARNHVKTITGFLTDQGFTTKATSGELFQILDPSINSISYLAALHSIRKTNDTTRPLHRDNLSPYALRFFESFNARQIRYAGDLFSQLVNDVLNGQWFPRPQAIEAASNAILRLDPTGQMLTSHHVNLVTLANDHQVLAPILPVIEKPYVFVPGMVNQDTAEYLCDRNASPIQYITPSSQLTGTLTREAIINYDYLCGLIFCSLGRWKKAYAAFGRIVAFPSRDGGILPTMCDAHKKWILTSLLALGQAPKLPAYIHPGAAKQYHTLSKAYADFAILFSTYSVSQLISEATKGAAIWEEDGNNDLIKEVLKGYQKWQIIGLSQIYCKLSIRELREQTKSAETGQLLATDQEVETLVRDMIATGMLKGFLDTDTNGTSYLAFLPDGEVLSETEFAQEMKKAVDNLKALGSIVETTDSRLMASRDYARHIAREQKRQEKEGHMADQGFGFDQSIEDEDLMVDTMQHG
ncbi:COP9 signalosome complex subunit 3 [Verticillium dahliae]